MGVLQKNFFGQNKKSPCEILSDSTRATGWFYSVFFTSRCDKAFQMKEIGRINAVIVSQKCLTVVPVVVPEVVP